MRFELSFSENEASLSTLSVQERDVYDRLCDSPRASSWLKGRAALKILLEKQGLSDDTSALSFPHPSISLSHSGKLAVAAGCLPEPGCAGIGVDFEAGRKVNPRIARFFLTEAEQAWLNARPAAEISDSLLRLWTVKEALFKSDPRNSTSVLNDYELARPGEAEGSARRDGVLVYNYQSFRYADGWLSIAMSWRQNEQEKQDE
jgi:phosphopantetheinyl transferase